MNVDVLPAWSCVPEKAPLSRRRAAHPKGRRFFRVPLVDREQQVVLESFAPGAAQ